MKNLFHPFFTLAEWTSDQHKTIQQKLFLSVEFRQSYLKIQPQSPHQISLDQDIITEERKKEKFLFLFTKIFKFIS